MKYGYGDYELGSLIKNYKKKNNKIIITFLDGTKKEEPLTNIKEEEILNKMLKQAIERNNNIKWKEILEKRKFSKNNIIKDTTLLGIILNASIKSIFILSPLLVLIKNIYLYKKGIFSLLIFSFF